MKHPMISIRTIENKIVLITRVRGKFVSKEIIPLPARGGGRGGANVRGILPSKKHGFGPVTPTLPLPLTGEGTIIIGGRHMRREKRRFSVEHRFSPDTCDLIRMLKEKSYAGGP
jgi:hypothetical protein